jgi:hypothetical protein
MVLLDFLATPQFSMSVPPVALVSELFYVLSRIGWLSILCYTVGCLTVFMMINLSGLCRIRYHDFSFTSLTSNQPVEGSIIVNSNNSFFPLGVFIVNGHIRSTSTMFQAMGLSASFSCRSPYFFLTLLPIWHS